MVIVFVGFVFVFSFYYINYKRVGVRFIVFDRVEIFEFRVFWVIFELGIVG